MGTRGSFPGDKAAGREADHLPPPSAEVKNVWSYNSTPQHNFIEWCSVKAQEKLYLLPFAFCCWYLYRKYGNFVGEDT
jgi:hypothetical protein